MELLSVEAGGELLALCQEVKQLRENDTLSDDEQKKNPKQVVRDMSSEAKREDSWRQFYETH
jgi:hypothetical protein